MKTPRAAIPKSGRTTSAPLTNAQRQASYRQRRKVLASQNQNDLAEKLSNYLIEGQLEGYEQTTPPFALLGMLKPPESRPAIAVAITLLEMVAGPRDYWPSNLRAEFDAWRAEGGITKRWKQVTEESPPRPRRKAGPVT